MALRLSEERLSSRLTPEVGQPFPLGATLERDGVNFALYAPHAERVELLLFETAYDPEPSRVVSMRERTGPVWHVFVPGVRAGQRYGVRVDGPWAPLDGHRFNRNKVLLDPYTRAIGRPFAWHDSFNGSQRNAAGMEEIDERDSAPHAPLAAVIDPSFDWQGVDRPRIPWDEMIVYEAHVRGLTMLHPDVPEELRGTFLGVASEPVVAHLKRLGVTTLSLLPVTPVVDEPRLLNMGLSNYWGYHPLAYFAPDPRFAVHGPLAAADEFKTMVRALHGAGIEVIVDVVYNHTGEGDARGPTLSFRGIDNRAYYKLNPQDRSRYLDYTGTGNTLDPGNPFVLQLITDSLRYWVTEMGVDGFRFDLASALARELYDVDMLSPFFGVIQQDPILSRVKLIAEPWDVGPGGYQVGNFPWQWLEWNGRYRDAVRSYWRGDGDTAAELATRVAGSSDMYAHNGRRPWASVNFVTAHDGFTLLDMVSYNHRHNHANGEANRDGHAHEISWNHGAEGESDDARVHAARDRDRRSLLATLLLSQGIPMLLAGDELSRSQAGNNNAYCQDNPVGWIAWDLNESQRQFQEFVELLIAFRKVHPVFRRHAFLSGRARSDGRRDVSWWSPAGAPMTEHDWHASGGSFGMLLDGRAAGMTEGMTPPATFLVWFHGPHDSEVTLPTTPDNGAWIQVVDTVQGWVDDAGRGQAQPAGASFKASARGLTVWREAASASSQTEPTA